MTPLPCSRNRWRLLAALATVIAAATGGKGLAVQPCAIEVVEKGTHWPVPMVELRTTHEMRFVTDNAGVIAFDLPESMGRRTWFNVIGDGYEVPLDGFGGRGVQLTPEPGKTLKFEVARTSIARILGRLTGAGIFAESQKLGREMDWRESGILGSDSALSAVYGQRLFWAWGDTNLPGYWLGIYDSTSATTSLAPLASLEPPLRMKFDYFRDPSGRPRGVAKMPGSGPTWLNAYCSLPDKSGSPRLVATYSKIKPPLETYERGLCVWNDEKAEFQRHRVLWTRAKKGTSPIFRNGPEGASQKLEMSPFPPPAPFGNPVLWKDGDGRSWVLFGNPLPELRCPATFEAWEDPATWETLKPQAALVSARDGVKVKPHSGSIAWNEYRGRWVTVFMEAFGKPSAFGEIWYAEADSPTGPWGKAVKVLSHRNYTFYNPRLHPELTPAPALKNDKTGRVLLFEGTHSQTFADRPPPTPRYDYNQILYRLDLDDPALRGAQAK